jgi:hypothetical protein
VWGSYHMQRQLGGIVLGLMPLPHGGSTTSRLDLLGTLNQRNHSTALCT